MKTIPEGPHRRSVVSIIPFVVLIGALSIAAYAYQPADLSLSDRTVKRDVSAYVFEDVAARHAIPWSRTPTWGSAWIDHDRDGWPELLINRHKRPARFYRGGALGPSPDNQPILGRPAPGRNYYDRHACSWGEGNGDGSPDLYCVAGAQKGLGTGSNQFLSMSGGRFVDDAERLGLDDPYGRGRTVNWIDFEGDGDLDLFVGNEVRYGRPNLTFRNDRGRFTRVEIGLTESIATMNSTVADWDGDGDTDIMVLGHGERGSLVYENTGGRFVVADVPGISGVPWVSAAWGDFDDDGWVDLHLMSRRRSVLFRNVQGRLLKLKEKRVWAGRMSTWLDVENDGDLDLFIIQGDARGRQKSLNRQDFLLLQDRGRFDVESVHGLRGPRDGSGDAVSSSDYDRDGRVDLLVTNGYLEDKGRIQLLRNTSRAGRWLGLSLQGDAWNPTGIGARIVIRGPKAFTRVFHVTDGFNFKAQSEAGYVHVGLGDNKVVRAKVVWPDGDTDCVVVAGGTVHPVVKGRSPCAAEASPTD